MWSLKYFPSQLAHVAAIHARVLFAVGPQREKMPIRELKRKYSFFTANNLNFI